MPVWSCLVLPAWSVSGLMTWVTIVLRTCIRIPEEPLWQPYDGFGSFADRYADQTPPTWWDRYFDCR